MAKSKKKKTPSRIKYEQTHRVKSFRISKVLDDKVREIQKKERVSLVDILKAGADLYEVKIRAEEEVWQEAYDKGWEDGVNAAEALYAVKYQCSNCRKKMVVTSDAEKKAIREYMDEHGWCHGDCNNPSY
ncbi:MAG: hypothetical protein JXB43_02045 [Dehalococcoidia bacterium]|nr:hypothetical protein [Dehalococcoidia bacterium]